MDIARTRNWTPASVLTEPGFNSRRPDHDPPVRLGEMDRVVQYVPQRLAHAHPVARRKRQRNLPRLCLLPFHLCGKQIVART